jgi:2-oxoglutarate ferredoxin oxidoreductase subunit alpha
VPAPVIRRSRKDAAVGIVSLGSCDAAVHEALDRLAAKGIQVDYCRIRAFPFGKKVRQFLEQHERVFVVEQNRDAQLKTLLLAETQYPAARLHSILHYGGLPMDHRCVTDALEQFAARGVAA